jgi:hypothetical protein
MSRSQSPHQQAPAGSGPIAQQHAPQQSQQGQGQSQQSQQQQQRGQSQQGQSQQGQQQGFANTRRVTIGGVHGSNSPNPNSVNPNNNNPNAQSNMNNPNSNMGDPNNMGGNNSGNMGGTNSNNPMNMGNSNSNNPNSSGGGGGNNSTNPLDRRGSMASTNFNMDDFFGRRASMGGFDMNMDSLFARRESLDSTAAALDAAIMDLNRRRYSMAMGLPSGGPGSGGANEGGQSGSGGNPPLPSSSQQGGGGGGRDSRDNMNMGSRDMGGRDNMGMGSLGMGMGMGGGRDSRDMMSRGDMSRGDMSRDPRDMGGMSREISSLGSMGIMRGVDSMSNMRGGDIMNNPSFGGGGGGNSNFGSGGGGGGGGGGGPMSGNSPPQAAVSNIAARQQQLQQQQRELENRQKELELQRQQLIATMQDRSMQPNAMPSNNMSSSNAPSSGGGMGGGGGGMGGYGGGNSMGMASAQIHPPMGSGSMQQPRPSTAASSGSQQWWICQICNSKAFASHEEALQHEQHCHEGPRHHQQDHQLDMSMRSSLGHSMGGHSMGGHSMGGHSMGNASRHFSMGMDSMHSQHTQHTQYTQHSGSVYDTGMSSGPFAMMEKPMPLSMPSDKDWLTPLHCFVRRNCVEVFSATEHDVATPSKGKRKPIQVGQVGIRCPHCHTDDLSSKARERGSVYYPTTISSVYNATMNLLQRHLHSCSAVPDEVMHRYETLKADDARSGTSKRYWVESALSLGLVDTPNGIRFSALRPPPLPSLTTQQETTGQNVLRRNSNEFFSSSSNAVINEASKDAPQTLAAGASASQAQESDAVPATDKEIASSAPLVTPDDKAYSTGFSFQLLGQMQPCVFTEADRLGKRKGLPPGFPGLACRHCFGGYGSGRFFPSSIKTLSDTSKTLNVLHNHMMRCRKCPPEVRENLESLRGSHDEERAKMKFGSQKAFFARIWDRLHGKGAAANANSKRKAAPTAPAPTPAPSYHHNNNTGGPGGGGGNSMVHPQHTQDNMGGYGPGPSQTGQMGGNHMGGPGPMGGGGGQGQMQPPHNMMGPSGGARGLETLARHASASDTKRQKTR